MTGSAFLPGWLALDQTARDAAYDNVAAVPQAAALAARRLEHSAMLRERHGDRLGLRYGPAERNVVDLYGPQDDSPCLVFVHGGYWLRNDGAGFAGMAAGVLAHGWAAAIPSYTLAPQARVGEIFAEIGAALDWYAGYRARHAMTGPLVLAGWSAGAALHHAGHASVDAVLGISGLYDLAPLCDTGMNAALRLDAREAAALSPLRDAPPNVPIALAVGAAELPALQLASERMAEHAGVPLTRIPLADHFSILESLASPDGTLTTLALGLCHSDGRDPR